MSDKPSNPPAFPVPEIVFDGCKDHALFEGMRLRDYFAIRILPALITEYCTMSMDEMVAMAYKLADAMLAEREKGKE